MKRPARMHNMQVLGGGSIYFYVQIRPDFPTPMLKVMGGRARVGPHPELSRHSGDRRIFMEEQ